MEEKKVVLLSQKIPLKQHDMVGKLQNVLLKQHDMVGQFRVA
jgi:hypothetical protein